MEHSGAHEIVHGCVSCAATLISDISSLGFASLDLERVTLVPELEVVPEIAYEKPDQPIATPLLDVGPLVAQNRVGEGGLTRQDVRCERDGEIALRKKPSRESRLVVNDHALF